MRRWFPVACSAFFLFTALQWIACPILVSYDGNEYIMLGDLLGSPAFRAEWNPIRTPGFPLALRVAFYFLGRSALAAQLVPLLCGALGCVLIADSIRHLFGEAAGIVTLFLLGLFPTLVAFQHMVLTETGTFFFLALLVRIGVRTPETSRAAWLRAAAFALVLSAGYMWRQSIFALIPVLAILQALTARRVATGRRLLLPLAQAALILLVPLILTRPWTAIFPKTNFGARMMLDFALMQYAIPPSHPALAPIAGEYRALRTTVDLERHPSGLPWMEISNLGARLSLPPTPLAANLYYLRIVSRHPSWYLRGVARTLKLFIGLDATSEAKNMRAMVLHPEARYSLVDRGPSKIEARNRADLMQPSPPGALRRLLARLVLPYDALVPLSSLAVMLLFVIALIRRDEPLLFLSGIPGAYVLAHAVFLMSIDRFVVPTWPIALACTVALAAYALRALQESRRRARR